MISHLKMIHLSLFILYSIVVMTLQLALKLEPTHSSSSKVIYNPFLREKRKKMAFKDKSIFKYKKTVIVNN